VSPAAHRPPTTALYTLSLHDALPIWAASRLARDDESAAAAAGARFDHVQVPERPDRESRAVAVRREQRGALAAGVAGAVRVGVRSEEHTSELQSRENLVCRLLLEKKK